MVGPVEVRPGDRLALAAGQPLALSVQEFRLLCAFAGQPGRVLTRDELYRTVWGAPLRPGDRSVDVYVRRLRVKLAAALPGHECLHTHFGFGYRFWPEPARSQAFHSLATGP